MLASARCSAAVGSFRWGWDRSGLGTGVDLYGLPERFSAEPMGHQNCSPKSVIRDRMRPPIRSEWKATGWSSRNATRIRPPQTFFRGGLVPNWKPFLESRSSS
jgi:hypothetical protein